jgi:glyoxylase-like metal-dependent hydrolase (beta-lactamase superfamily II)
MRLITGGGKLSSAFAMKKNDPPQMQEMPRTSVHSLGPNALAVSPSAVVRREGRFVGWLTYEDVNPRPLQSLVIMGRDIQGQRTLSKHVTVIEGTDHGKYPHGNSVLVRGSLATMLIDPSLTVFQAGGPGVDVDRVLVSHAHEDHMVGLDRFPGAHVHIHHDDLLGVHSLDGLMQVYGMPADMTVGWSREVVDTYMYRARPDAAGFADGERFDLGGVTVTCVHLAGHTRGHSGFLVEPDGVFFVGDIDLTGFGPYYGDHWSSLVEFEESLVRVREFDAHTYVTFHQKGVIDGRETFVRMLDDYAAVIARREEAMLAFLAAPRTVDEMVAHRFVYRPHVEITFADHVERRTAEQHLARFVRRGQVTATDNGRYAAAG